LEKCVIPTLDPPIGLRKTNLKQQVYYPLESLKYFSFSISIKGVFMLEMETLGGVGSLAPQQGWIQELSFSYHKNRSQNAIPSNHSQLPIFVNAVCP